MESDGVLFALTDAERIGAARRRVLEYRENVRFRATLKGNLRAIRRGDTVSKLRLVQKAREGAAILRARLAQMKTPNVAAAAFGVVMPDSVIRWEPEHEDKDDCACIKCAMRRLA